MYIYLLSLNALWFECHATLMLIKNFPIIMIMESTMLKSKLNSCHIISHLVGLVCLMTVVTNSFTSYLLQQLPIFPPAPSDPSSSLFPPLPLAAPASPSLGSFLAMARKMSFTLSAVFAEVSMNKSPFSSA